MKQIVHFLLMVLAVISCKPAPKNAAGEKAEERITSVGIQDSMFLINGKPTLGGREWRGYRVEGLLPNSRMVQGIFDDTNAETRDMWAYPDTKLWDAERNTDEFIRAMEDWKAHGLLAFTINFQGGSPQGYSKEQPWVNSAFDEKGNLKEAYAERMEKILNRADELGMVAIVGLFYFGQDEQLEDEQAVINAADNAVNWMFGKGYTNVLIEVNNECDVAAYNHEILKPARVHELINRIKGMKKDDRRFPVSTSFRGNSVPTENVVAAADFILVHGNGVTNPDRMVEIVQQTRALPAYRPMPVVFNEDDHYDFDKPWNNFVAATSAYASWGYFDFRRQGEAFEEGFQSMPAHWGINSERKKGFFRLVNEMSGGGK